MSSEWPELKVLELLVGIDECGSLGAAARAAGIAQPNATRMVQQIEGRFGTKLVQRSARGSTLSAEGTVIAHWARQVLADMKQLVDAAEALRAKREAELTIASSMTVAEFLLPLWLGRFRGVNTDVHVHLQMQNSAQVCERVAEGSCDVGFVEGPSVPEDLNHVAVAHDQLIVVVTPQHPWARRRRSLTMRELASTPLLAREPGSGTRRTLDVALQAFVRPPPLLELGSSAAIRASVLGGVGPAVVSSLAVAEQVESGELVVIDVVGLDLHRTLRAVWRSPRQLAGSAGRLVNLITRDARNRR
jgi:molybdate transport repressor ModE-like protein